MQSIISIAVAAVIIGLVIWLKSRGRKRPIKRNGIGILIPVVLMLTGVSLSLYQVTHISGNPFHLPASWELFIAGSLGTLFGLIMLKQTAYERREDGQIYAASNKNFKLIIIAIVLIRLSLAQYFKSLDPIDFTVLTTCMALFYLGIWRIGSYVKFRKTAATSGV